MTSRTRSVAEHANRPADDDRPWMEDELDFARHLGIVRRHWILIVAGALVGALAGLAIGLTRTPRYEAVTGLVAHMAARPGTGGVDRATLRAFIENQTLVTEVLQELGLNGPPHQLTPQRFAAEALRVDEPAGTNLFKLRVQLGDAALAAEASRRLARKAVALNKRIADDTGAVLRNELKPHVMEAGARLKTTQEQLVSYQREAQIELLQADSAAMVGERGDLLRLLVEIEGEKARLKAAEEELRRQQPLLSAGRLVDAEDALRRAASVEAERLRDGQAARRTEKVPSRTGSDVSKLADDRRRADDREMAARSIESGAVNPEALDLSNPFVNPVYQTLQFQLAMSRTRLAVLQGHRLELMRKVGGPELKELTRLYQRQVDLARRQNEYDLARRVFDEVSLRYEKANTDLLGNSAYLQVIDEAVQPDQPMPRKRVQTIALGLLLGLVGAAVVAVVRDSGAASRRGLAV